MTTSQVIGNFAAWQKQGGALTIVSMIRDLKIKGAARQATADAAMLHMIKIQGVIND